MKEPNASHTDQELRVDLSVGLQIFGLGGANLLALPRSTRCAVFKAMVGDAAFAVKVYPSEMDKNDLYTEIDFVRTLYAKHLNVPKYILGTHDEYFYQLSDGSFMTVYDWINGKIEDRYQGISTLRAIAEQVGKIHFASTGFKRRRSDDWLWADARHCFKALPSVPDRIMTSMKSLLDIGKPWGTGTEYHLCHSDYGIHNIVQQQDGSLPGIIDFTNAIPAPREWDLAGLTADYWLCERPALSITELLAITFDSYAGPKSRRFFSNLKLLFRHALVQRAIFAAYVRDGSAHARIWETLEDGLAA